MKPKASRKTQKIVQAIYLASLADVLNKRLVMKRLETLLVKNHINKCGSEYNPPS